MDSKEPQSSGSLNWILSRIDRFSSRIRFLASREGIGGNCCLSLPKSRYRKILDKAWERVAHELSREGFRRAIEYGAAEVIGMQINYDYCNLDSETRLTNAYDCVMGSPVIQALLDKIEGSNDFTVAQIEDEVRCKLIEIFLSNKSQLNYLVDALHAILKKAQGRTCRRVTELIQEQNRPPHEKVILLKTLRSYDPNAGDLLFPEIRQIEKRLDAVDVLPIGAGGMATVFKLTLKGKLFGLKLSNRHEYNEHVRVEREIIQQLNERLNIERSTVYTRNAIVPCIASDYIASGCIEIDSRTGFLMEFIEGATLAELLDQGVLFKEYDIARIMHLLAEIALSMALIHECGILHCDFKPENIIIRSLPMLGDGGLSRALVCVIDFNSSVTIQQLRRMQQFGERWTKGYAPPEQFSKDRVDSGGKADVFSFGILAYKLVLGALKGTQHSTRSDWADSAYDQEWYTKLCDAVCENGLDVLGGEIRAPEYMHHIDRKIPVEISEMFRSCADLFLKNRKHSFIEICRILASFWMPSWGRPMWVSDVRNLIEKTRNPLIRARLSSPLSHNTHSVDQDKQWPKGSQSLDGPCSGLMKQLFSGHSAQELLDLVSHFTNQCQRHVRAFRANRCGHAEIWNKIAEELASLFDADTCSLLRWDHPTRFLTMLGRFGFTRSHREEAERRHRYHVPTSDPLNCEKMGITGHAVLVAGAQVFGAREEFASHPAWSDKRSEEHFSYPNRNTNSQMVGRIGGRELDCYGVAKVESVSSHKYSSNAALVFASICDYLKTVFELLPEPKRVLLLLDGAGGLEERIAERCTNGVANLGAFCISAKDLLPRFPNAGELISRWQDEFERADIVIAYDHVSNDKAESLRREMDAKNVIWIHAAGEFNGSSKRNWGSISYDQFGNDDNLESSVHRIVSEILERSK